MPAPEALIVIGDRCPGLPAVTGCTILRLAEFRARHLSGPAETPVLANADPLAVVLPSDEAAALADDPSLSALFAAAGVPVIDAGADPDPGTLLAAALSAAAGRLVAVAAAHHSDTAALARLRMAHQQQQDNLAALEAFVHDALAPGFALVRDWPVTEAASALPLTQPLPAPTRGFAALDLHIAGPAPAAGTLTVTLQGPGGEMLAETGIEVAAGASGWHRAVLSAAPGGPARDAAVHLAFDPAGSAPRLSLSAPAPFDDIRAMTPAGPLDRPVAARVFRTLPGLALPPVALPGPDLSAPALLLPRDLPAPQILPHLDLPLPRALRRATDPVRAERLADGAAILLRPSARRPLVARLPAVPVAAVARLSAVIHLARTDAFPVSFALGVAPAGAVTSAAAAFRHLGDWATLPPGGWGEVWWQAAEAIAGPVDILLATTLREGPFNAGAAGHFRAFRLSGQAA